MIPRFGRGYGKHSLLSVQLWPVTLGSVGPHTERIRHEPHPVHSPAVIESVNRNPVPGMFKSRTEFNIDEWIPVRRPLVRILEDSPLLNIARLSSVYLRGAVQQPLANQRPYRHQAT
jgi:hypothetical protein